MNNNIKFSPVDEQSVRDRMLAVENISALTKYGFLGWVAPHLYFGGFEDNEFLPSLCDWSWIEDWVADKEQGLEEFGDYRVIGSGPDGEPMVYKPNSAPIYLVSNRLELKFINSSYYQTVATASAFLDVIDQAVEIDPSAVVNCSIPKNLIDSFISSLNNIEPATNNSIWVQWAHEHCKAYN